MGKNKIKFWNIVNKEFIFFTPPKNEKQKKKNQFLTKLVGIKIKIYKLEL